MVTCSCSASTCDALRTGARLTASRDWMPQRRRAGYLPSTGTSLLHATLPDGSDLERGVRDHAASVCILLPVDGPGGDVWGLVVVLPDAIQSGRPGRIALSILRRSLLRFAGAGDSRAEDFSAASPSARRSVAGVGDG